MKESLSIKKWSAEDRPREKMLQKGIQALSNAELIALLIRSGTRDISAVDLARKLLQKSGDNLNNLGKIPVQELMKFKGIGKAKAVSIVAALELGKRRKSSEVIEKHQISGSRDVFEIFQSFLGDLPHEEFWMLLLNRSNRIIKTVKISQGGTGGTVIDVKLILKTALDNLASAIILCHNHPSGNLKPSRPDIDITCKLKSAADIMDIKLLDHVIVSDHSYYSFADEGELSS